MCVSICTCDSTPLLKGPVYVKEGFPFAQDLSLENSRDSYYFFDWCYFFFLYQSPSLSLCIAFDAISSNIDEVLLINPSANVFVIFVIISICSKMAFPPIGNSDTWLSPFPLTFHQTQNGMPHFIA